MQEDTPENHKPHKNSPPPPNRSQISLNIGLAKIKLPKKNTWLKILVWVFIIIAAVAIWKWHAKNTIPAEIRSQVSFHAVFPTKKYDQSSFQYSASSHTLQFKSTEAGIKVLVTEQPLPANSGDNPAQDPGQMLSRLGVRYFSQTQTRLGVVSVAKFWTRSYSPNGQTAILGTHGVLVLAHPGSDLSPDQWTQVFNSLAI